MVIIQDAHSDTVNWALVLFYISWSVHDVTAWAFSETAAALIESSIAIVYTRHVSRWRHYADTI